MRCKQRLVKHGDKVDPRDVNYYFTNLFEIDGDTLPDVGLHLTYSPIGLARVLDPHAGFENRVGVLHGGIRDMRGDDLTEKYDLASLIGARMCHDLISPLGAIGNGVELLQLDAGPPRPELDLIAQSVGSANAKLRFLRVAYGTASDEHRLGKPELAKLVADWCAGGRLRVAWDAPGDHGRIAAKLVFLGLQCIENALPRGGEIRVDHDGQAWVLTGEGPMLRPDETLWPMLEDLTLHPPLVAAQVQFGLLQDGLRRVGWTAEVRFTPGSVALRLG